MYRWFSGAPCRSASHFDIPIIRVSLGETAGAGRRRSHAGNKTIFRSEMGNLRILGRAGGGISPPAAAREPRRPPAGTLGSSDRAARPDPTRPCRVPPGRAPGRPSLSCFSIYTSVVIGLAVGRRRRALCPWSQTDASGSVLKLPA